jgi:predicted acylesterase/phospholipase RssA
MGFWSFRAGRGLLCAASAVALAAASGCLRTSVLVQKFNDGVIETGVGDPKHPPVALRKEKVERRVEQELIDGYFGQSGPAARVAWWLRRDGGTEHPGAPNAKWFSTAVGNWLCDHGKTAHVGCPAPPAAIAETDAGGPAGARENAQTKLTQSIAGFTAPPAEALVPLCSSGVRNDAAVEVLADTIRYRLALRRAVEGAALLVDEGVLPLAETDGAAATAFEKAAAYLGSRKWQRSLSQPTAGLVVKGGASTGIFSAGAAWVALNIEHECSRDAVCQNVCKTRGISPMFQMMSGTSTGAMVSTAVDIYNVSSCEAQRQDRLKLFQKWFVCSPAGDLYCTVDGSVGNLVGGDQLSLLEFDGLKQLLSSGVEQRTLQNRSELILNVVDFRTGRYDAFSDQDPSQLTTPSDVANAAVASAALPVIVRPEPHLPSEPDIKGNFTYLDGGIRSELPIAAAVRRGAERLLIISSGPSVMPEASERKNGLDVLVRYIDVSTGGVLESEIDWAPRLAESRRLAEFTECRLEYDGNAATLCPDGACNPVALCSGDFGHVCSPAGEADQLAATRSAADLLSPIWRTTSIYRSDDRVPGLPGYLFRRADQRKLFLAGAEEARQRCLEITSLLGLPASVPEDPTWRKKLLAWCAPTPEPIENLCQGIPESEVLRSCSQHPPPAVRPTAECPHGGR